jgi:putative NIF3 family GTP cyclohydrolase 1 type 2
MPISSDELVQLALEMSGMDTLPADSSINVPGSGMSKVMFGIDIAAGELLLAKHLGCDGVIAHHPAGGTSRRNFQQVLTRQIDFMVAHGVPPEEAREAAQPMILRATMAAHANNADHVPSVARLLGMPLMNMHLPLDELGRQIMVSTIDEHAASLDRAPTVQDAIDALMTLPELANADTQIMVPVGSIDNALGRLAVVHGAGTNGGARVAQAYFNNGVDTVLYIHCNGDEVSRLRDSGGGNLIVTGHIASDLIGINPYVAAIEQRGVEVVRMSGL